MQQQGHDDEQTRAAEYPTKPQGSLAIHASRLQARCSLESISLVPLSIACYTPDGRAFSGVKGQALAKQAMNSLPA
jgi:hypothetical protein